MGRTVGPCPSRRKDSDHRDVFTRVQSDGGLPTRPDRGSRGRAEWGAPHAIGMLPRLPPNSGASPPAPPTAPADGDGRSGEPHAVGILPRQPPTFVRDS